MYRQGRRLSIDIGGTFTDIVLDADGVRHIGKVLTTPLAPEEGFLAGALEVMARTGLPASSVDAVVHGTTLATNAIIERKGAETVLVTTAGFRDAIEIAYEYRFEQSDLNMTRPVPLVARKDRFEVPERVAADGSVLLALDEAAAEALAVRLGQRGAKSVAVCLLHSYVNETHERRLGQILAARLPDASVSLSCEVSPEIREYDRMSTTVANAYVRPLIEGYLRRLVAALRAEGFNSNFLMVTSSGGMTTLETACRFPIRLVESGPAGGAILAKNVAAEIGATQALSFDMGGTTAKICLVDDFQPLQSRSFEVARHYRFMCGSGFPLRIPVIEMVEIGAGGGSIATVDDLKRIAVGPESTSSSPGPACYGRGGQKPTVTDADLVLSRLDADRFAGGRFALDKTAAEVALARQIGERLAMTPAAAAAAVSEIVDENMANAARVHAVEWGKDLDQRTMIAFGGAAPLHAARLAEKCGIRRIVVPTGAGVGSAIGFLQAPVAYDITRSFYMRLDRFDAGAINALFARMRSEAEAVIRLGVSSGTIVEERTAFMRYLGQGHEIDVALPARDLMDEDADLLRQGFDARYTQLFGRTIPKLGHEVMTWRLSASIPVPPPQPMEPVQTGSDAPPFETRDIFDPDAMSATPHGIYRRHDLALGQRVRGPAVIVEDETSTLVSRAFDATVMRTGYLMLERKP